MSMTATAHPTGTGFEHEIDVNGRHTIVTDEPVRLGGSDRGPAPHELLAATLASCVATMVAMYARNRGWELGETAVEVDYDPERVPRAFTVQLRLPDGLSDEQLRKLVRVAQTCPVRRALEGGFVFEERVIVGGAERAEPSAAA
jgi:putative redox protein